MEIQSLIASWFWPPGSAGWNPFNWSTATYLIAIAVVLMLHRLVPRNGTWYLRLGREVMLIAPAIFLYFAVRGVVSAREEDAVRHADAIIRLQSNLRAFHEPTLQEWILQSTFMVDLMNWVYIWGHWPVVVGTLVWLIVWRPKTYSIYRDAFLISGIGAMFVFALFPVAPPRLMPDLAVIDTVTEQSRSYRVLQPPALTNPFAAMPSLHFGWNLLMGIAIVRESHSRAARWFGYTIPVAMFLAIVLTANHYFLDGIAGGALVLASLWVAMTFFRTGGYDHDEDEARTTSSPGKEPSVNGDDPRERHPLFGLSSPITIAHRAGNSIELARASEAAGIDVLEADLWLHRGRLEVRHSKTLGPLPVRWDRWWLKLNPEPCLELADLLRALSPKTRLMLDLKGRNPELPRRLLETMRRERAKGQILVCSQNWRLLEQFRDEPDVSLVHSIGNRRQLASAWQTLAGHGYDAVSIHMKLLNPDTIRMLKERVGVVITWPINSPEALAQVESLGVSGVISDDPKLLSSIVARREQSTPAPQESGTHTISRQ